MQMTETTADILVLVRTVRNLLKNELAEEADYNRLAFRYQTRPVGP